MHQYENIYIGIVVMNNQAKSKLKCKCMDYDDRWRFRPWAAYHYTSMMQKALRGHCYVGEKVQ